MRQAACRQHFSRTPDASSLQTPSQLSSHAGRSRRRARRTGFTLIELAIAVPIIGLGVASTLAVCGAVSRASDGGRQLTQAVFLAESIREWTVHLPLTDPDPEDAGNPPGTDAHDTQGVPDDLDDLLQAVFVPPRDGTGYPMYDQPGWAQTVNLTWVKPDTLTPVQPGGSDAVQVEVQISFQGKPVFTASWLATGR